MDLTPEDRKKLGVFHAQALMAVGLAVEERLNSEEDILGEQCAVASVMALGEDKQIAIKVTVEFFTYDPLEFLVPDEEETDDTGSES